MTTAELDLVKDQDEIIVSGSLWAAIWHMAWPGLLQMVTISCASFVDVWVAGRLGAEAQAAIGLGGQIWFFMTLFAIALSSGASALVSRFWGAKDIRSAVDASRQSLAYAVIFGFITMALGLLIARPFYRMLGATPAVEAVGWDYLKFDLLSQMPFTFVWVSHSIFRAKGNPRLPLLVWVIMAATAILGDVLFCLNPLHFGVEGIGASWAIAGVIGMALNIFFLGRSDIKECVNFSLLSRSGLSLDWFKRILGVGVPACLQELAWIGGNFVLFLIFAHTPDPTSCQASWAVGLRVEEMIVGLPVFSLGMAAGTIVGQNLGAKQPDRAERAGWHCSLIGGLYSALIGLIMFTLSNQLAHLTSHDPKVVSYTQQYFYVLGPVEPFAALWMVLFGAMQGAGYTKWPMVISTIFLVLFRLPLAWYLTVPLQMVPMGCWISIAISATIVGALSVWRFHSGIWKLQKV
jgi:putative MATE family efflux protein